MAEVIPRGQHGKIKTFMSNLEYLPCSDRRVITRPVTTLVALEAAYALIAPSGCVSVLSHTEHKGGATEGEQVSRWCHALDFAKYRLLNYSITNKQTKTVRLLFAERIK